MAMMALRWDSSASRALSSALLMLELASVMSWRAEPWRGGGGRGGGGGERGGGGGGGGGR